mmetsp:Transcript_46189/g.117937  ORF Transcript_46189/g.117937 Transcript_46189/m.117937 type:complete len:391 (-) Transcript_46189:180-1352(-)|eukprot:jgi/Tetstr1/427298/TSEL_017467.t1
MDGLHAALKEAESSKKKQRTSRHTTEKCIDDLLGRLTQARAALAGSSAGEGVSGEKVMREAAKGVTAHTEVAAATKELHSSVSKLGKIIDRAFFPDICKAHRPGLHFNQQILDKVIAQHLFREGHFSVGREFCEEAGIEDVDDIIAPFVSMHEILQGIRQRNLDLALRWVEQHKESLSPPGSAAAFHFQLHRLQFLHLLDTSGRAAALEYARGHFGQFSGSCLPNIQRLMGSLLFAGRLAASPYADLLSDGMWQAAADEFTRQCCGLLGQASESPLLVAVSAGAAALPQLLKLAQLLKDKGQDLTICEQLPVELELGHEFVFHSIFACPVSRDQSSAENPPTMLPCGHVLCKQSVAKLAKGSIGSFKCPYCPMEAQQSSCKELTFPDAIM